MGGAIGGAVGIVRLIRMMIRCCPSISRVVIVVRGEVEGGTIRVGGGTVTGQCPSCCPKVVCEVNVLFHLGVDCILIMGRKSEFYNMDSDPMLKGG